jgi:hypothetical protein
LLSIHITPHITTGTAAIQYAVWESGNPFTIDTLTWLISSGITAISEAGLDQVIIEINDNQMIIQNPAYSDYNVSVIDVQGKILIQRRVVSAIYTIDFRSYKQGIYFVGLTSGQSRITRKIFIK